MKENQEINITDKKNSALESTRIYRKIKEINQLFIENRRFFHGCFAQKMIENHKINSYINQEISSQKSTAIYGKIQL